MSHSVATQLYELSVSNSDHSLSYSINLLKKKNQSHMIYATQSFEYS